MDVDHMLGGINSEIKIEDYTNEDSSKTVTIKKLPEMYQEIYGAYKQKDYEKCLEIISRVTEKHVEYEILKCACMIQLGTKVSEAHDILDKIIKDDPNSPCTIYAKGLAFYHEEKWEESIDYFEKARQLDPSPEMERAEVMRQKALSKLEEQCLMDETDEPIREIESPLKRTPKPTFKNIAKPIAKAKSKFKAISELMSKKIKTMKRLAPEEEHILRRFGCDICDHFFGKKFNLDRHNRTLHNRDTPIDFPQLPTRTQALSTSLPRSQSASPGKSALIVKRSPFASPVYKRPSLKNEMSTPKKIIIKTEPIESPAIKKPIQVQRRVIRKPSTLLGKSSAKGKVRCKICKKMFKKGSFSRHSIIHTGNKTHQCDQCDKAFFQKSDLNRHEATHSDVLSFECDECDRKFRIKKNLNVHKRRHHTN